MSNGSTSATLTSNGSKTKGALLKAIPWAALAIYIGVTQWNDYQANKFITVPKQEITAIVEGNNNLMNKRFEELKLDLNLKFINLERNLERTFEKLEGKIDEGVKERSEIKRDIATLKALITKKVD